MQTEEHLKGVRKEQETPNNGVSLHVVWIDYGKVKSHIFMVQNTVVIICERLCKIWNDLFTNS